jgi:3-oxoacyl-[acyl-carrier-protein] synthase-3
MGARIESAATSRSRRGPLARGALHLSDAAARECLARAGHPADDIDLLVNAGLYRDKSMAEPALASIIQEDIGANPGHPQRPGRHGTFSFDVLNGGCGAVSAAHLVDAFVGTGTARLGLIVAGDADPAPRRSHGFPFPPVGGALLLAHTDTDEGFVRFGFRTFPQFADLFEVRLHWEPTSRHNILDVREQPGFASRCVECAAAATRAFLAAVGLRADDVELVVTSQYPASFPAALGQALGISSDRVPVAPPQLGSPHTAGPIAALESAIDSGQFARARNVLFVTAGAGITTATALYRKAPSPPRTSGSVP